MTQSLAERILAVLPQTQCTRCGYPDCAAYAQAIASDGAAINQCPPGGLEGVQRLSAVTGRPATALNPDNGLERPRSIAVIDENWCIGCTLCLPVCPTDAILGSNKMMHTVIEPYCTGCELCLPVCPVDCITMENVTGNATGWGAWSQSQADTAGKRYDFHSKKANRYPGENQKKLAPTAEMKPASLEDHSRHTDPAVLDQKRAMIESALARAKALRT